MKFRKKPVEIEALQLGWDTWGEMCYFVSREYFGRGVYVDEKNNWYDEQKYPEWKMGMLINTLEGQMLAVEGDWIIKGIKGEFYPCKPDTFLATYDLILDE